MEINFKRLSNKFCVKKIVGYRIKLIRKKLNFPLKIKDLNY